MRFFVPVKDILCESAFKTHERGFPMTEEAFEQAVRDHANTIFRVACHTLKDRQEAEDVTQTVLLRLYQYGWQQCAPLHSFGSINMAGSSRVKSI